MKGNFLVICDSSPLIHLSKNNLLFLLEKLYIDIYIPNAVYNGIFIKGKNKPGYNSLINAHWIHSLFISNNQLSSLLYNISGLHPGEIEVMALADQNHGSTTIIDDGEATEWARNLVSCHTCKVVI